MSTLYRAARAAKLKCIAIDVRPVVGDARGDQTDGARAPGDQRASLGRRAVSELGDRRSTRSRVAARTLGESLSTRETVWCETPASRATSKMLGARSGPVSATFVVGLGHGGTRNQREERSTDTSADGTVSMILPSLRTATRSPTRSTSSSSAEMNTTDRPLSGELGHEVLDLDLRPDVDPAGGLVQDEHAG